MDEMMQFPNTVEEFMEKYKIVDKEQVYTNGAELVPMFRMKQWFISHPCEPPRWIPVTERLPEEICDSYWVCTDSGYQCECRWTNINPFWANLTTVWHWNIFDIPQYTSVIAWMPLPEPYKEGEQNV